jgi:sn-glycerol 3-phosphate transport system ATP-binding protein
MVEIRLVGVSKVWGSTRAVDDVTVTAHARKLLVLLGPSGCGKSTTLRLIAGLETATSGRIWIGDRDVTDLPPSARNLSMVFQSYALFPHLTVRENILFGLKVRRVPRNDREKRLARAVELLGIDALLARRPGQLSGGQQQRVALGRAIVAETPVCLMDEPLSNLDAQLRHDMRREIRRLQQTLGITMAYVTHDQTEAMSMADHVVLLRDGRVEQSATPDRLYARPETAFVARFIGTPPMNIARLANGPGGAVIRGTRDPAVLRGRGDGLLLGLRPEHITVGDAGVAARVVDSEYLGADTILKCAAGDETLAVRVPGRAALAPGAVVHLAWAPEAVHVFDAASGRRYDESQMLDDVGITTHLAGPTR